MRGDTVVEQVIAHDDVEMVRRFVFELPLSDVTVVDGERAVLECRVAVALAAEVTWYVDTSFTVRGLRAGADYYFRVIAENGASQLLTVDLSFVPRTPYDRPSAPRGPLELFDVARSSVALSWLARTSNGGAAIVTHVIEQSRAPVTDVDVRRAGQAADGRRSPTNSASASKVSRSVRPMAIRSFSRPTSRSADS